MGRKLSDVLDSLSEERRQRIAKDRDALLMKHSTQADLDAAAVERSLAILRQARTEIAGWYSMTLDPDASTTMETAMNELYDLMCQLQENAEGIRKEGLIK